VKKDKTKLKHWARGEPLTFEHIRGVDAGRYATKQHGCVAEQQARFSNAQFCLAARATDEL
jgi:hypothetical protein